MSEQGKSDFDTAVSAFETLISTITSQGIFSTTTLVAILEVFKQLLFVAVDLVQGFISVLAAFLKYAAASFLTVLQTPVSVPVVAWIYESLMDNEPCTLGGICCLVTAVPFTLLYKAIAGKAPFQQSVTDVQPMTSTDPEYLCLGIWKVVSATFSGIQEMFDMVDKEFLFK